MSRVSAKPIPLPKNVEVKLTKDLCVIKGPKGEVKQPLNALVLVEIREASGAKAMHCSPKDKTAKADAIAGTTRALLSNVVLGVSQGFERQLELVGVGYRAQVQGQTVTLSLGFSHPVKFPLPKGVTAQAPSNTLIILHSADKQLLGQVAAQIREIRPPEPYKGKGVRYAGEQIILKETKKK